MAYDYAALAKKFGGKEVASEQPPIDYEALAAEFGGVAESPMPAAVGELPVMIPGMELLGELPGAGRAPIPPRLAANFGPGRPPMPSPDAFAVPGEVNTVGAAETGGYIPEVLGGAVEATAKGIAGGAKRIALGPQNAAEAAMGPLGPVVADIVGSHVDTAKKAYEAGKEGDYVTAAGYTGATALPFIGPQAASIGERWAATDDPRERAKLVGEAGMMAVGPRLTKGLAEELPLSALEEVPLGKKVATATRKVVNVNKKNPVRAAIKAWGLDDAEMMDPIPEFEHGAPAPKQIVAGLDDIKAAAGETLTSNEAVLVAGEEALKNNRAVMDLWHAQGEGKVADGTPIVAATKGSLSSTLTADQRLGILKETAENYAKELTPDNLRDRLVELNAELKPFYSRKEDVRSAAITAGAKTGKSLPVLEAQAKAIRDIYYKMLDPKGKGMGPREVQYRYGMVNELVNVARKKRLKIEGEKPISDLAGAAQVVPEALGGIRRILGGPKGALAIPGRAGGVHPFRGASDPMIEAAFEGVSGTPNPLPLPFIGPKPGLPPLGTTMPAMRVPPMPLGERQPGYRDIGPEPPRPDRRIGRQGSGVTPLPQGRPAQHPAMRGIQQLQAEAAERLRQEAARGEGAPPTELGFRPRMEPAPRIAGEPATEPPVSQPEVGPSRDLAERFGVRPKPETEPRLAGEPIVAEAESAITKLRKDIAKFEKEDAPGTAQLVRALRYRLEQLEDAVEKAEKKKPVDIEADLQQTLRDWKAFSKEHGEDPMKWTPETKGRGRELLAEYTQGHAALHSVDPQEAARFKRRGMLRLEDLE